MVVFLDCEFTDFIDIELISIALVTEDGRELYIERSDFGVERCSAFTREAVLPRLARPGVPVLDRDRLRQVIKQWFAELSEAVTLACDHQVDYELLIDALDGSLPANLTSRLDLSQLEAPFHRTVSAYHAVPGQAWHHALHDARAFLAAWRAHAGHLHLPYQC
ncbi:hypothetical protein [Chromobacterium haemolyticum]|uniref:hypothetical protein n=1 Tax=Chromobacterium haemolyticum TaxID=394935 RepID=UPI0012DCB6B5|nr:hypothetical protein [Chromobacterium haemolyticum]